MTDRELMQMALDALDWKLTTLLKKSWENHHIHEVIKALRDRLAQPEWVGLTDEEFEEYAHWIYPEKLIELENLLKEKNT
jgi:hypothetical protein